MSGDYAEIGNLPKILRYEFCQIPAIYADIPATEDFDGQDHEIGDICGWRRRCSPTGGGPDESPDAENG